MKFVVPLMMPAIHWMRLAVRPSRKALMMGMPPATAASKATMTPLSLAAAKISVPCTANSALLAVTTCLPAAMALSTSSRARVVPPINSTTMSTCGSVATASRSSLIVRSAPRAARALAGLRAPTRVTTMPRPARRWISAWLRANTLTTPVATTPAPSRPRRIGFWKEFMRSIRESDACGNARGSGRCGRSPRPSHRSWAGRRDGNGRDAAN
ncbi:MAG: hypothetical protein KatS3mg122_2551 [Caldimonas sp.]|nr:MAG: hypothetical protein KatS3mg122_2551 [Caldimonas sp.]